MEVNVWNVRSEYFERLDKFSLEYHLTWPKFRFLENLYKLGLDQISFQLQSYVSET